MKFAPALRPALACLALCAGLPVSALVIDTGPGASSGSSAYSLFDDRPQQLRFQQLAAQFTVTETSRIESVGGWMYWYETGSLSFAIHANVPVSGTPGSQLFQTVAAVQATGNVPDWRGASGLDWSLQPGQYWLVFADVGADFARGSIPGGAALPLGGYAFESDASNGWVRFSPTTADFGVRINSPIPEPSTTLLMSLGAIALVAGMRRR